ncbi:MAG TPA: hypothetical protein VKR22_16005, partial [Acidimicrobiales bacterium]|nr:hypothetical protein [Acidimicrobiales bacterium]
MRDALSADALVTDPGIVDGYRFDRSQGAEPGWPCAVVRVASTGDVQAALRWAGRHRVSVVPRGA